jgi:3-phosphoshikimate 1-carboxyvinyltransferase
MVSLPGDVSSQYVTALMLIGPLLTGGLVIELTSPLVSRPYVTMTAEVMASFGVGEVTVGQDRIVVPDGRYQGCQYVIEPDASSASYPLAAAAITGGRVVVERLSRQSLQGDAVFLDLLGHMGVTVLDTADGVLCDARGVALRGLGRVDLRDASDLVPTVAVLAAFADGPTRIDGVGFIRAKESDRLGDLSKELAVLGITATPHDDGITIEPPGLTGGHVRGGRVATHHDHRLAMALALVGLATPGVTVEDPQVVTKSWPGYFEAFESWSQPTR